MSPAIFVFQRGSMLLTAAMLGFSGLLTGCMTKPVELVEIKPVTYPQVVRTAPRSGSLFQAASYRPAFEDPRARMPGDTVTIQITEKVSASQSSSSNVDRAGSSGGSVTAIPFVRPKDLLKADNLKLAGESSTEFGGGGGTENANTFSGVITATVQEVLPNGHLVVVGDKQIGVNNNVDVLRFSGTIDPRHIRPGNVVASAQVANARIESKGRGQIDEALSIGWLGRFFLNVMPF
jgi:flagellar L-ring protein precursor FlgH